MKRRTPAWMTCAVQGLGVSASLALALLGWPACSSAGSFLASSPSNTASAPAANPSSAAAIGKSGATATSQAAPAAVAASAPSTALHHLPASRDELASLQNGARRYLQSCVACHSAAQVTYGQLQALGMTLADVQALMPEDPPQSGSAAIVSPLQAEQAVQWFGAAPPDLSLATRTQGNWRYSGADRVYSYLRGFYRDPGTRSGWNNTLVPGTAMPHVLAALQADEAHNNGAEMQSVESTPSASASAAAASGPASASDEAGQGGGQLSPAEYEQALADITLFMQWMAEPDRQTHEKWGWLVCALFAAFAFAAWRLHASYWKEVQ
ncbi:MAG: cytochrome c1 [Brachymonas sp.]|nr:cytochrome c1 [Brachymonas sp.]